MWGLFERVGLIEDLRYSLISLAIHTSTSTLFHNIASVHECAPDKTITRRKKCLYLYWTTPSAFWVVLPRGPVRATPHGSSVTTGGNRSTRRIPAMLGRVKLDNTLLTSDQGNFSQITARSRNRTLVTVARDTCAATVPPATPRKFISPTG